MPIYEYVCKKCNHQFEKLEKMNEQACHDCPECHAHEVERMVSAAGFQLKGSGWYVTDFKDKKPTNKTDSHACSTNCEHKGKNSND